MLKHGISMDVMEVVGFPNCVLSGSSHVFSGRWSYGETLEQDY